MLHFKLILGWKSILIAGSFLLAAKCGFAQTSAPSALLQAFQNEQETLRSTLSTLESNSTPEQLASWHLLHAARLHAQDDRAQLVAAYADFKSLSFVLNVDIPDNATPELESFLVARANLHNQWAQLHNSLTGGVAVSLATDAAIDKTEGTLFQQENASALKTEDQLSRQVAEESARQPLEIPPPLEIPADASPEQSAYLIAQDQYERDEITAHNQACTGDRAQLDATLEEWHRQNAPRLEQIRQMAEALTATNPN